MPVLMIAEVPNLTEEIYGGMVAQMMPLMRASKGFIAHSGGPGPSGGWRVVEIWESEADGEAGSATTSSPTFPPASTRTASTTRCTPPTPNSRSTGPCTSRGIRTADGTPAQTVRSHDRAPSATRVTTGRRA